MGGAALLALLPGRDELTWPRLLSQFRYKPGWTFTYVPSAYPFASATIRISFQAQDAYHPERTMPVTVVSQYVVPDPPRFDETAMLQCLRDGIALAERHEMDEWFVYDGRRPFNPHKPKP